jgi:condensin complex subunit 2
MSQTNVTFAGNESESFGTNNFDYDGDDDDDDDAGFNDFLELDECAAKYASTSFLNDTPRMSETSYSAGQQLMPQPVSTTVTFLDMISNGDSLVGGHMYGYFDLAALQKMIAGNTWAGASHWKKFPTKKKMTALEESGSNTETKPGRMKKICKKTYQLLDFTTIPSSGIYSPPKKAKRSKADPLQLSEAVKRKNANSENCLPRDSGVGAEQLTRLFCRPKAQLRIGDFSEEHTSRQRKTVGFADDMNGDMLFNDESCDDGPGFQFNGGEDDDDSHAEGCVGNDDYAVKELAGIRKVAKVRVGFATVAKKVDVKRLKKDLWQELQSRIGVFDVDSSTDEEARTDQAADDAERQSLENAQDCSTKCEAASSGNELSFQRIVSHLDAQQSQVDVTLPFYFICVLHLANEKGLKLEAQGGNLKDFIVRKDDGTIIEAREIFSNDSQPSRERTQRGTKSVNYEGLDHDIDAGD